MQPRLGAAQKRVLLVIGERADAGKPFPTVDDIALTKVVANRGAARNIYAELEKRGLVSRREHGWASGYFTDVGRQLYNAVYDARDSVPARQRKPGVKVWEPALGMRTVHTQSVASASMDENPFKDGRGISKIGHIVTKGWLRGASIHYLTLEERKTCPSTCAVLDKCYGDSMVRAVRWRHGKQLEDAIEAQFKRWDRSKRTRLLRVHELGDFYSPEYVEKWGQWLQAYPWLNVFGYTAWPKTHEIGQVIAAVRTFFPRRFAIRQSDSTGLWGSVVVGTGKALPANAFWCPEQRNLVPNCGSCGACWSTKKAVAFKEH